jgi:phosphomannomutase/phosphoglucomutase
VAGEGNGGVIFPNYRTTRDGAYTGARFLELLADGDRSASEVVEPYSDYHNVRVNVGYEDDAERDAVLAAAEDRALDADANRTTIDGYRLDYGDAWVLVRPSGTEPVVRIYVESTDREHAEELAEAFAADLRAAKANA